jgi:coenzyme F420 hydrogenase subunit beta
MFDHTPPGLSAPALPGAARPGLCTDCGVSRLGDGRACGRACQFIKPDYAALETRVHGRTADPARGDEAFFGVTQAMLRARLTPRPPARNGRGSPRRWPRACWKPARSMPC